MNLWYPWATRDELDNAGAFAGGPYRGVLHTTEGTSYVGAKAAYKKNNSAPHFTVRGSDVWQHVPLNRAARSLQNRSGGVETNRMSAVQIEVVGRAAKPDWDHDTITATRLLMWWLESELGIRPEAPRFLSYPASYGLDAPQRMTAAAWKRWDGWCGHQHVPENSHGDPGSIPLTTLLYRGTPTPDNPTPPGAPMANAPFAAVLVHPEGGYLEIGEDGGVFAFGGAPFYGSLGGQALNHPIIDAAWTPTHQGYYLIARDGGVFTFGDAEYHGNTLWAG